MPSPIVTRKIIRDVLDGDTDGIAFARVGTPTSAAGTSVRDRYAGGWFQTVITFAGTVITMTDATTAGSHGSLKLYDFPVGQIGIVGAVADVDVVAATGIGATASLIASIGTATVGVDNATLTGTEADIIPSTAATLTGSAGTFGAIMSSAGIAALTDNSGGTSGGDTIAAIAAGSTDTGAATQVSTRNAVATLAAKINSILALMTGAFKAFDGTGTAKDAYLNFAVPDAGSSANSTLTLTGTVTITWVLFGDM